MLRHAKKKRSWTSDCINIALDWVVWRQELTLLLYCFIPAGSERGNPEVLLVAKMLGTSCKVFLWQLKLIICQFSHWDLFLCPLSWYAGELVRAETRKMCESDTLWLLRSDHKRLWAFLLVCWRALIWEIWLRWCAWAGQVMCRYAQLIISPGTSFPAILSKVPHMYVTKPFWKWLPSLSSSSSNCLSHKVSKSRNKLYSDEFRTHSLCEHSKNSCFMLLSYGLIF